MKIDSNFLNTNQEKNNALDDLNNDLKIDSNFLNTNQEKINALNDLKYSTEYQSSVLNFFEVETLKFKYIEEKISKTSIFKSSILDFEQVIINESNLIENFLQEKLSCLSVKDSSLFSFTNNSSESLDSFHSNEIKTDCSEKIKNKSLNSSDEFFDSTNKFESNLHKLYQTHKNIVNEYINSDLNEEKSEKTSKTFLIVPSLYQKYGFNLIKLFENQVGKFFF